MNCVCREGAHSLNKHPGYAAGVRAGPKTRSFRLTIRTVLAVMPLLAENAAAQQFWNINGAGATWTSANWGSSPSGPFTSAYTANSAVQFTANSAVTFATVSIGNVTVAPGQVVTVSAAGTLSMNNAVRTFDIGAGALLDWRTQTVTANSTAGITKIGAGDLRLDAWTYATAMSGGFTLNAGTVIVSGNKALGSGALTLNGGVLQSSGTRSFAPTSLVIGGDFAFSGAGDATFGMDTALGAATRTITNSLAGGSRILSGKISGSAGAGLTFAGTGTGVIYISNALNDFSGAISVTGAEAGFSSDGSFGAVPASAAAGAIVLDGGCLSASDAVGGAVSFELNDKRGIQVGAAAGTAISVRTGGTLTYNGIIADRPAMTGAWSKLGGGVLALGGASTYSGSTTVGSGTLRLAGGSNRLPACTTLGLGQSASASLGTLDLGGCDQEVAGINSIPGSNASSARNVVTNTGALATLTLSGGGACSYGDGTDANSGIIAGPIRVVKTGAGTQVFGDANTYSGETVINAGTLALKATGAISRSPAVTIAGGATFSVAELSAAFQLGESQALVIPGAGAPGTIATAALRGVTLNAGSELVFPSFTGIAPLAVSGEGSIALSADAPVTVTVANGGVPLPPARRTYKLISSGAGNSAAVTGTAPSGVSISGDGVAGSAFLEIYDGELYLNVVAADMTLSAGQNSESLTISSLQNEAAITTSEQGAQVWAFTVTNPAGSAGAGTVACITFVPGPANGVVDWSAAIQAATLFEGGTNLGAAAIAPAAMTFGGLDIEVASGNSRTIALRISLKNAPGALADNSSLQVSLSGANIAATGNSVAPAAVICSGQDMNRISVVASRLGFAAGMPSIVGVAADFSAAVQAQDANGNVDTDCGGHVVVSLAEGSCSLSAAGGLEQSLALGAAAWPDLQVDVPGEFMVQCSCDGLASVTSAVITAAGPLAAGDLSIIGYRSASPDGFAFVAWKAIYPNCVLGFWDHGCEANGTFRLGENRMTWAAPPSGVAAGTVVKVQCTAGNAVASVGVASGTLNGLSDAGDQIFAGTGGVFPPDGGTGSFAYEGTLLYALNTEGNWLISGVADASSSYQPQTLTGLHQSFCFASSGDNGQYIGDRTQQTTWTDYKALVHAASAWVRENTGGTVLDTAPFVLAHDPPSVTITNPASNVVWVGQSTASYVLEGSANANAVGLLQWTNSLTGEQGAAAVASGWSIVVPLAEGANAIVVTVTNAEGSVASDSVTVRRMKASTNGAVIISEFMQNPKAVSDGFGEWVELFNRTDHEIDIQGWTLRDLYFNNHVISSPVVIPARGFVLLGSSLDTVNNGGAPVTYQWLPLQFSLGNAIDEILLLDAASNEVSRVEYSEAGFPWPDPDGASMYLRSPDLDVNDPASWASSTSRRSGFAGVIGDFGSPCAANPEGAWCHQTVFVFQ